MIWKYIATVATDSKFSSHNQRRRKSAISKITQNGNEKKTKQNMQNSSEKEGPCTWSFQNDKSMAISINLIPCCVTIH